MKISLRPAHTPVTRRLVAPVLLLIGAAGAGAQPVPAPSPWQASAVLDVSAGSRALALGSRDKGLGLGHSDLSLSGPLGRHLDARITAVAHTADRKLDVELEEAWAQTRTLPAGLQLRAGRFASQLGYLNEQHPHTDDFVQRPLLHRAFLGGHWTDDGVRLNWTAPTAVYLRLGAEALRGRRLSEQAGRDGALVLSGRLGGDIGRSQSWQAGLSVLDRRTAAFGDDGHEHAHEDDHSPGEAGGGVHGHGAAFTGRRLWLTDLTWKWAPEGNNLRQQVRVTYEHARVTGAEGIATGSDRHQASYLGVVWRFAPAWEVGVRGDVLRVRLAHEGESEGGKLREAALALAYRPTEAQTLRLQFTRQQNRGGFAQATHAAQVQYIVNFGSHAAHGF